MVVLYTTGYADEHFPFLAQVSKESVNIRAGANTNFEKIDKLSRGTQVVVLGKSFDWYKIQLPKTSKAFVRADYLKIRQNSIAEITGDKVNIRAAANSNSTSLGLIKQGDLVKIKVQSNGWWQIEPPEQAVGWVRQDFLSAQSSTGFNSFIKGHRLLQEPPSILATIEIKGQLMPVVDSKTSVHYKLMIGDQIAYYVQSVPNIDRFKGAVVLIKGFVVPDNHQYIYPVLQVINISLVL